MIGFLQFKTYTALIVDFLLLFAVYEVFLTEPSRSLVCFQY